MFADFEIVHVVQADSIVSAERRNASFTTAQNEAQSFREDLAHHKAETSAAAYLHRTTTTFAVTLA